MKKLHIITLLLFTATFVMGQNAKTHLKNAKKEQKAADHTAAIKSLTKSIALDANLDEAYFLRAQSFEKVEDMSKAYDDYAKAAALNTKNKVYALNSGRLAYDLENYKASVKHLAQFSGLARSNLSAIKIKAKAYYALGDYENAYRENKDAIYLEKTPENYYYKGLIGIERKAFKESEAAFISCAKSDEDYPLVFTKLALVRLMTKNYDKAKVTCDRALEKNKNDAEAYRIRGLVQFEMKNVGEAKSDLTRAINIDPEYMEALSDRASIYENAKEDKLAATDYKTIVNLKVKTENQKQIVSNAKLRLFEIYKEFDKPVVQLISPKADAKGTITVLQNEEELEMKFQINDDSKIDQIKIDNADVEFNKNQKNPFVKRRVKIKGKDHISVEVQDVYSNREVLTYNLAVKTIDPPRIAITEPYASSNGETYIDKDQNEIFVEGRIRHSELIKTIKVDGLQASFLKDQNSPTFSAKINVENKNSFIVETEGIHGTKSTKKFTLMRTEVTANNPMGNTWVIFVENSNYKNFSSLEGPTKDINMIKSALAGYSINKIIHKKDLSKSDLERFFAIELRDQIKKNRVNSLMVWYAGHGKFVNETGYWIPTDAKRDDEYSYFSINSLRASMQAYDKGLIHNLVITDACESGPSFYLAMRDAPKERKCGEWEATKFKSAQVLSSAGYELAADNSQFTKTFSAMLKHNPDICIPIEKISNKVMQTVAQTGHQKPKLGKIKGLDDQNGTFFFIKKDFE